MFQTDIFTRIAIDIEEIQVNENSILQLLGYDGKKADPFILETIKTSIKSSLSMLSPLGGFIIYKIEELKSKEGLLLLKSTSFEIHKIIAAHLKNSEYVAVFYATIGKGLELQSSRHFHGGNMLEGYIYNLIGSEAAESAAEFVHQKIKNIANYAGYSITNRFSPGYCNWNVKEQFKLFGLFPDNFNDITLTESALMNPVKSVSGIIGIGENAKYKPYTCKLCDDDKCIYRNKN